MVTRNIEIILIVAATFVAAQFAPIFDLHRAPKHTGPAQFSYRFTSQCYWFLRPNHEIFEMCFDNPPPMAPGTLFDDITYVDDNADFRHFVKAQLNKQSVR